MSVRPGWHYLWRCVAVVAISCTLDEAEAHAPPLGFKLLTDRAGEVALVVANRGLIFRDGADRQSRLMCNEALGINTAEIPSVVLLEDDSILAGTSGGLKRSADHGCTWLGVGAFGELSTPAVASDPSARNTVYIATYGAGQSGIWGTRDGGASWLQLFALEDVDYVVSLLIAGADPRRIYATGTTFGPDGMPSHFLLRSRDAGATWERIVLPLLDVDYLGMLLAADPNDVDTLLVGTTATNPRLDRSRLLVSHDAGDTFTTGLETLEITGAGYDAGGDTVWVSARDGLYRAESSLTRFTPVSQASFLGCAMEHDGTLWVCGHYAGEAAGRSGIGVSLDRGESFSAWLDFASVSEPVACGAETQTALSCLTPWHDWAFEMLGRGDAPSTSNGSPTSGGTGSTPGNGPLPSVNDERAANAAASDPVAEESARCDIGRGDHGPRGRGAGLALLLGVFSVRRCRSFRRAGKRLL